MLSFELHWRQLPKPGILTLVECMYTSVFMRICLCEQDHESHSLCAYWGHMQMWILQEFQWMFCRNIALPLACVCHCSEYVCFNIIFTNNACLLVVLVLEEWFPLCILICLPTFISVGLWVHVPDSSNWKPCRAEPMYADTHRAIIHQWGRRGECGGESWCTLLWAQWQILP